MKYSPIDKYPSNSKIVLLVILVAVCFNLFAAILFYFSIQFGYNINEKFIQSLSQILFLFGLTLIVSKTIPLKFSNLFRLEENIKLKYFAVGVIGLVFLNIFNTGYISFQEYLIPDAILPKYNQLVDYMTNLYEKMLLGSDAIDFLIAIIIGAIVPAISEEFLFRGFGQRALEEKNTAFYSIIIISVIFGFIHLNIINLIPLILIGLFLGYLAYYSKSIIVPIFIHFLNNSFSILYMYLEKPESVSTFDDISLLNSMILTLCGLIGVIGSIIVLSKLENLKT